MSALKRQVACGWPVDRWFDGLMVDSPVNVKRGASNACILGTFLCFSHDDMIGRLVGWLRHGCRERMGAWYL